LVVQCPMIKRRFISDVYEGCHLRICAFTLVELLVVISVIAMILGVLLPALNKAKQRAKSMVCSSNIHQISMASLMYTQDHDGRFPLR
jgi:prepilin-type N-terminal cleavage/methylation domain-containing protein